MALGKNKRISKGGKRGKRGKAQETMARKEWYDVVAPSNFEKRQFSKTICNKTQGTRIAADVLRGRVFEANLADLNQSAGEEEAYRKVRFTVQEVQGRNLLTQFHSMEMTTDKMASLLRKWCTTMETTVEVRTADGYTMRLFVVAFTKPQANQQSRNCYAKQRLVKWLRKEAVSLLTRNVLSDALVRRCNPIVPLREMRIRKVRVVRTPKFDAQALLNAHGTIPTSVEADPREVEEAVEAAPAAAKAAE
ncbi:putative Ribosomal S3Ae family [Leishmania utingensis]|uniref:Small ribosomal subunit protein eS1 n=1 Tax=Leishmania utingensis TaxID=653362 RepID=A0AAW2ZX60_9TRYP